MKSLLEHYSATLGDEMDRPMLKRALVDVRREALSEAADLCRKLGAYSEQQEMALDCEAAIRSLI